MVYSGVCSMQAEIVVDALMKYNKMTRRQAVVTWAFSKTFRAVQGVNAYFGFISPARCYDELCRELAGDPYWMTGTFD